MDSHRGRLAILLIALVALPGVAEARTLKGSVAKVVDGDTVKVKVGKATKTFDLTGINAPELTGDAAATCFGAEAKAKLAALLKKGAAVKVKTGSGRSAEILRSGRSANRAMVDTGHARALPGGGRLGAQLRAGEASAKSKGLGLHKACGQSGPTPTPPQPAPQPPASGDITGQSAIDQMTNELRGMHLAQFTSGSNSSTSYHLHLCADSRWRYFDEYLYSNFGNTRHEALGKPWTVVDATIKASGDRVAKIESTMTSYATNDGPGTPSNPNDQKIENTGGSWYWNGVIAQGTAGGASCEPVLQHS